MKKQVPLPFCDGFLRVRSTTNKETKMLLTCKIAHYIIPLRGGGRRNEAALGGGDKKHFVYFTRLFTARAAVQCVRLCILNALCMLINSRHAT